MINGFEIKCQKCGGILVTINWWNKYIYKDGEKYMMNGKKYRKIGRSEIIKEGAMQSWCNHELQPIRNPETIGDIPDNFSPERNFFNPV